VPAPPRRFLLVALVSTADLAPFIALGAALRADGHEATLLADSSFSALAESSGLAFAPLLSPIPPPGQNPSPELSLEAPLEPHPLAALYTGLAPGFAPLLDAVAAHLPNHDALITSRLFPFLKNAARAAGRPCAILALDPDGIPFAQTAPTDSPPPAWLPRLLHASYCRSAWRAHELQLDQIVNRFAGPALQARQLGKFRGFLGQPTDRVLVAVSPALLPPPGPLPVSSVYTGFLLASSPSDAVTRARLEPIAALAHAGSPVPVLALPRLSNDAATPLLRRVLAAWPRDFPLVIHAPHAHLTPNPQRPEILFPGPVPENELFNHATIVIHDGRYATTAAALYAGRAQIILPPARYPSYWTTALPRLGVARVLNPAAWPEQLVAAVDSTLRDVPGVRRVAECACTIRAENGPARAVTELEKLWPA